MERLILNTRRSGYKRPVPVDWTNPVRFAMLEDNLFRPDWEIAILCGCTPGQITYARQKFGFIKGFAFTSTYED